ncbi:hypothetical protein P4O66_016366 [Electrophorus voltai]|uniref:ribonuclease H n=1 Tax=Electrophorus voltai TaxID=2609070 RepID=A0AAD8YV68_9TELE|nr:hypothetical protein P4O66_016366 [Electrophorus voltai]
MNGKLLLTHPLDIEYLVLPYGLATGPSVFQAYVNDVLREFLGRSLVAYINDILICSSSLDQHVRDVRAGPPHPPTEPPLLQTREVGPVNQPGANSSTYPFPGHTKMEPRPGDRGSEPTPALPTNPSLLPICHRQALIAWAHASVGTGHPGSSRTAQLLSARYWWPAVNKEVVSVSRAKANSPAQDTGDMAGRGPQRKTAYSMHPNACLSEISLGHGHSHIVAAQNHCYLHVILWPNNSHEKGQNGMTVERTELSGRLEQNMTLGMRHVFLGSE